MLVKQPHRYSFNSDGYWFSPPALSYADQFGFDFQIFSDAKINWILYRNLTFLEDYYRAIDESKNLRDRSDELIENIVRYQPGITLNQLLDNKLGISADSIYFLIASEQIYIDLGACLLVEPEQCQVFCDREYASSHKSIFLSLRSGDTITLPVINLVPKEQINWDGQIYTLLNCFIHKDKNLHNVELLNFLPSRE